VDRASKARRADGAATRSATWLEPGWHEAFIVGLHEMAARLLAERAVIIRRSAERLASRAGLDVQKSAHALEQERPDLLKRRRDWFEA